MKNKVIIEDLKKVGVEVFKSPFGYYTIKTKKIESNEEILKECQRIMLNNNITIPSVKKISVFMKENLETYKEESIKNGLCPEYKKKEEELKNNGN